MSCSSLLLVALLFNAASWVFAAAGPPEEDNSALLEEILCPDAMGQLMELAVLGDDSRAVVQVLESSCPHTFGQASDQVLETMIKFGRTDSFICLFDALESESQLIGALPSPNDYLRYRTQLLRAAFVAHRPQICYFLTLPFQRISKRTAAAFWKSQPSLWTLDELVYTFPPGSPLSFDMMASDDVLCNCKTLEACRFPLQFNLRVMAARSYKYGPREFTRMLRAFLENQALADKDMAALIPLFVRKVTMEDKAVEDFSRTRPNYPLSHQALASCLLPTTPAAIDSF
jgi:hypothetical protein